MTNLIADQADIAETNDPDEEVSQLEATRIPVNEGMEFHVQMKGYTLVDFDKMVIEAAARMLLGRSNDSLLAKEIQNKCIELTLSRSKLKETYNRILLRDYLSLKHLFGMRTSPNIAHTHTFGTTPTYGGNIVLTIA